MKRDNLYKRGDTWYARFTAASGEEIRKSLSTTSKAEARERLKKLMEASWEGRLIKEHAPKQERTVSFSEAFAYAYRVHAKWRDSNSQRTIDDNFRYVCDEFPEHIDMADITPERVLVYSERLREAGKAPSTINQRLSLISVCLTYAEKMTNGRVKNFKMPRQSVRNGRIRILSRDEEARVLAWFDENNYPEMSALVMFLVDTGFRLSEALRVRSAEVDWDNGLVPAWETKADHPRQVPMTRRVREVLTERNAYAMPLRTYSLDRAEQLWQQMRKGIGIDVTTDPEFVLHALRHTCASRLASAGMDAFRIQKWMGHKNIATTQKYVTLFASDLHGLAKVLDGFSGNAPIVEPAGKNCAGIVSGFSLKPQTVTYTFSNVINRLQDSTMLIGQAVNPQVPGSSPGRGAINQRAAW